MFSQDVIFEIGAAAREAGMEPAALLAVAEVESGGRAFTVVEGKREPLIRFEGHYFDRRLDTDKRAAARERGLAAPVAGAIANPASQPARWRMLRLAAAIDAKAAYESASWGLGQVMGAHWAWLGYADVEAFVAEARAGVAGQLRLMVRYIDKAGLADALRRHDWAAFARGYNGPNYRQNAYDRRIASAHRRYADAEGKSATAPASAVPILRRGSRGEAVRGLQRDLTAAGHPTAADGAFGPATHAAVRKFQTERGLVVDGIAGPKTMTALVDALVPDTRLAGFLVLLADWLKNFLQRRASR